MDYKEKPHCACTVEKTKEEKEKEKGSKYCAHCTLEKG